MKIAIIGAGFGGMAAAYDLAKAGHDVTILEAEDHPAGLASGFKEPGWDWSVEKFYHHWFAGDKHMLALIEELGELRVFPKAIVTRVERAPAFWPAEPEHHDYYTHNSDQPYCQYVVAPKIAKFRSRFGVRRMPGSKG
jgi:uncharacterized protein with NAD-binding domain and iron-sulfur cluster